MSFRLEDKIKLHISDKVKLKNLIHDQKGSKLYPNRIISSVYFDNKYLDMYKDSEEGTLPRKKIRIRNYPQDISKVKNLEIKITSVEGKFKKNEKISESLCDEFLNKGIFDPTYGLCNKIINISYEREYWKLNDARLTIDFNLKYENPTNQKKYFDTESLILEIKSSKDVVKVQNSLTNLIPIEKQRFSKYCDGINRLYNQNHSQRLFF